MKTETQLMPGYFFGRCLRPTWSERTRGNAQDLLLDGLPVPWSDEYAQKFLDAGETVEKIEFVTETHPHYPDETITRRMLVATIDPERETYASDYPLRPGSTVAHSFARARIESRPGVGVQAELYGPAGFIAGGPVAFLRSICPMELR